MNFWINPRVELVYEGLNPLCIVIRHFSSDSSLIYASQNQEQQFAKKDGEFNGVKKIYWDDCMYTAPKKYFPTCFCIE